MRLFAAVALTLLVAPLAVRAEEVNVALASNGASIRADSEYLNSSDDTGGQAPASRLIDGVIRDVNEPPGSNRWHSDLSRPHPHWVWVRFAKPARIHKVVLWRADIGAPVDFVGQTTIDQGRTLTTLFTCRDVALDADNRHVAVEFAPIVTDNLRLLITRSSNKDFPQYTQASELEVYGEWAGAAAPTPEKPAPERTVGELDALDLPDGLTVETSGKGITYSSRWMRVGFPLDRPGISFLGLDAGGYGTLDRNLLKGPRGIDLVASGWDEQIASADASFTVSQAGAVVKYAGVRLGSLETDDLTFTVRPTELRVTIDRHIEGGYIATESSPFRALFDAAVTPPSPMGKLLRKGELAFPVFLHFPDHGSLLVRATGDHPAWRFVGRRGEREVQLSLVEGLRSTDACIDEQRGGTRRVTLTLTMPKAWINAGDKPLSLERQALLRGWLNLFQFRPDVGCLANNSISDNVLFCMYEYADQALFSDALFDDFGPIDLVRASLDSYFDGTFGYGGDRDVFMDSDPSIVIAAWDCVAGSNPLRRTPGLSLPQAVSTWRRWQGDLKWLSKRIGDIRKYADHIVAADVDGDGLPESKRTGNSGSGINGAGEWSSNWWDVISFGWKDAYSIALDYRALRCMADMEQQVGNEQGAKHYRDHADAIHHAYYSTFYDPKTGVLAGWKSKDGQLHDYYFTFVNGIACAYGLVTKEQGNAIMDKMQAKFKEVGYTNFRIGMPGNLIPVARRDYAGGGVLGQPSKDDGSDSFQSYENGGATGSFAYFYIQGLYALGRKAEADAILTAMYEGYRDGVFQNGVGSGVDWKRWDGKPCGYEGLLTDTYYALTAYWTGKRGEGVPMADPWGVADAWRHKTDEQLRRQQGDWHKAP